MTECDHRPSLHWSRSNVYGRKPNLVCHMALCCLEHKPGGRSIVSSVYKQILCYVNDLSLLLTVWVMYKHTSWQQPSALYWCQFRCSLMAVALEVLLLLILYCNVVWPSLVDYSTLSGSKKLLVKKFYYQSEMNLLSNVVNFNLNLIVCLLIHMNTDHIHIRDPKNSG